MKKLLRKIISYLKRRTMFMYWREERKGLYVIRCVKCGWAARSGKPIMAGKYICRECGSRGPVVYV